MRLRSWSTVSKEIGGDAHVTEFNIWSYLGEAKDWKCWCFALNFGMAGLVTYSAAYFLPIILRDSLGFDVAKAQCLTAPVSDDKWNKTCD